MKTFNERVLWNTLYIKREGDVSFIHSPTAQTTGPRKMKFGAYLLFSIYGCSKKGFFEIQTLKGGKGSARYFQGFSRSLKPEKISHGFSLEK